MYRKNPGLVIRQEGACYWYILQNLAYNLNNASFWPKYMHIAIKPPSITKEKKNGGLWRSKMAKSATNRLVNNGWSTNADRIFLQMAVQFFIVLGSMWK